MQILAQEVQLGRSLTTTTSTPADIFTVAATPQNTENTTSCSVLFQMIHWGVQTSCTRCLVPPSLPPSYFKLYFIMCTLLRSFLRDVVIISGELIISGEMGESGLTPGGGMTQEL